jgi:hypothetical protein
MRETRTPERAEEPMNAERDPAPPGPPAGAQSSEEALIGMRRSKAEALRQKGENPFPNAIDTAQRVWLGELRAKYAPALTDAAEQKYDPAKFAELGAKFAEAGALRVLVL